MLEWKSEYETGVLAIDAQHKVLFDNINRLEQLLEKEKPDQPEVDNLLTFLEDYTKLHFNSEETCMARFRCPAYAKNKEDHALFMNILKFYKDQYDLVSKSKQIELEKQVVKDRGIAGELLNRIARRVAGSTNSHVIGSFAGFQVLARPAVLQPTEIILKGRNYYTAHLSETALGTIRSLEHAAQNLEERLAYHQRELADTEKKCGELETKVGQAFEHETKLQSLGQRQKELEEGLDISKNQASNALAAEETELQAENEAEGESVVPSDVRQTPSRVSSVKTTPKVRAAIAH